jgi:hypothetical protein
VNLFLLLLAINEQMATAIQELLIGILLEKHCEEVKEIKY